jgi:hypothetical protein
MFFLYKMKILISLSKCGLFKKIQTTTFNSLKAVDFRTKKKGLGNKRQENFTHWSLLIPITANDEMSEPIVCIVRKHLPVDQFQNLISPL